MNEARDFGAALRRERERRGITLDVIAEQTKVSASLLAGLERGDLSRWPAGIFRRAFVRSYAAAVGLDPEDTLAEFLGFFPDEGGPARVRRAPQVPSTGLRLGLADSALPLIEWRRAAAAGIDASVLAVAVGAGWWLQGWVGASVAGIVIGLCWHGTATVLWGMSPGLRLFTAQPVAARPHDTPAPEPEPPAARAEPVRQPAPILSLANSSRGRGSSRRDRRHAVRTERTAERDARRH